jgi:hypothetical protein
MLYERKCSVGTLKATRRHFLALEYPFAFPPHFLALKTDNASAKIKPNYSLSPFSDPRIDSKNSLMGR